MKQRIEKLRARIDDLSIRERGMLFLSSVAVLVFIWQSMFMDPMEAAQKNTITRMNSVQKEIEALNLQAQVLLDRGNTDPDEENLRLRGQLRGRLGDLEERIAAAVHGLVEPRQMAQVLEEVLTRETDLQLMKVESLPARPLLPPEPLAKGEAAPAANPAGGIYQHGVRMEFAGSYLSTLSYLRALQELPRALYWDGLEIEMEEYPRARVVITVHTLSLSEGWIGV